MYPRLYFFAFSLLQNRLYAKYGHLPDNTILVQPEACHALSSESELSSCHECYRFLRGRGNDFAICQFEGFRKIRKKVAKPLENALISFCEVTFLDPVQVRNAFSVSVFWATDFTSSFIVNGNPYDKANVWLLVRIRQVYKMD